MKKEKTILAAALFGLIVLAISTTSGYIEIRELLTEEYDATGYIDYRNTIEQNSTGTITIYIDTELVLEDTVDLYVRPFHGFLINRPETLEFALNTTSGKHLVTAYIYSGNVTVNASCSYYGEEEEQEEEPELIDWLPCPCGGA